MLDADKLRGLIPFFKGEKGWARAEMVVANQYLMLKAETSEV